MSSSVSSLTAQPKPLRVKVRGEEREYLIHPLTIDDLGQLQAWVDRQFPDPFAVVRDAIDRGNYTVSQQQYLIDRALNAAVGAKHLIGSPEADRVLLSTLAGSCELLKVAIRKGRELSDEEAKDLYMHLTLADLGALATYSGIDLVASDPKGPPTTPDGTGSSTSRRRRRRPTTSTGSTTGP